ncbi:MAG: hypothetical protein PHQ75_06485 [Thermoguttaceae bacterium]|nr:hypothetical protein [Thermoguttaceae bacterium]
MTRNLCLPLILIALCLLVTSVSAQEKTIVPDVLKKEIAIGYWSGPAASDHFFKLLADAHFTFAWANEQNAPEAFKLADKYGLKLLVIDKRREVKPTDPKFDAALNGMVRDWSKESSLWGYFLRDEPHRSQFEYYRDLSAELRRRDPNHVAFINLLPSYAGKKSGIDYLGTKTYLEHVRSFVDIVKPQCLCFDHYGLWKDGTIRFDYFENMRIIQEEAKRAGIPFIFILLSLQIDELDYRNPTPAELNWQVNSALVHGARGIMYFTMHTTPGSEKKGWLDAILDSKGNPLSKYDVVRQINGGIRRVNDLLVDLSLDTVWHTAPLPYATNGRPDNDPILSIEGGEFVVGHFTDSHGKKYTMLFNRSTKDSAVAKITVSGTSPWTLVDPQHVQGITFKPNTQKNSALLTVPFNAGDRRLFLR